MESKALNYRITIEPDAESGYVATCPTLGVAAQGESIEDALKNIESLMKFHLECLLEEKVEIPEPDNLSGFTTWLKVPVTGKLAFS